MTEPRPDTDTEDIPPEVIRYIAAHPAPAGCADALIRDDRGRVLLVDPVYKPGWDLPGGMTEDEGPAQAVARELLEELGLRADIGRLLTVDTVPASVYGRTLMAYVYAAHPRGDLDPAAFALQHEEIRAAEFFAEDRALELLPAPLRRRLAAALEAERGAHTAVLIDGQSQQSRQRDYYAQLPAPMTAATVLVTDRRGRVLILKPSYKEHLELPGGMVLASESPADGAARELLEELGLRLPVGRVLAVDPSSAAAARHGRALTCFVYATPPLTDEQAAHLGFPDGEVLEAYWTDRAEVAALLPPRLAARVEAGLEALAAGTTIHLERGVPTSEPGAPTARHQARAARAAMVERLVADGVLTDPALREALLAVRREELVPRCYIPRPTPEGSPRAWQLLDGSDPRDRAEWLELIHGADSVMVQHAGEAPGAPARAQIVLGGGFTAMTTAVATAVEDLQALRPRPGDRALELGTGPGLVTAALCEILGAAAVTGVEVDQHLVDAARTRLAGLGHRPTLVCGEGTAGHRAGAPYDRILLSFAVRSLPRPLLEQLADGGTLVAPIHAGSTLGPARAVVHRAGHRLTGVLHPVPAGHRPARGVDQLRLPDTWPTGTPVRTATRSAPPDRSLLGLWVAVAHLAPGLVRAPDTERLVLHAPDQLSVAVVQADGTGWNVERTGPRDIWAEVELVHESWTTAGRPAHYRIEITPDGQQHITGGTGPSPLTWTLPAASTASSTPSDRCQRPEVDLDTVVAATPLPS